MPNVVMDEKPGKAYIEFLSFDLAKEAYSEISMENSNFKLKIIKNEKIKDNEPVKKFTKKTEPCEVTKILEDAGIKPETKDDEFNNLDSLDKMEALLMAKF